MKRVAGLLIATCLMPALIYAQAVVYDYSKLYESSSPAVVQVTTQDGSGSGFLGRSLLARGSLIRPQPDDEVEGAAASDRAFHPNPASHQLDQLRADRQSQTGAAISAGHRTIGLNKRLEDDFLFFCRNPDAGIGDDKMQIK